MKALPLRVLVVLAGPLWAAGAAWAGEPGKAADAILEASGVRAGLCVHLGATDGRLTAALGRKLRESASGAAFIVQGLAGDAAAVRKARAHVQDRGLYREVSVVRSDFRRLPYADDLVNLVVSEDLPALLGADLRLEEVFRVLVPNGALCFGGKVEAGRLTAAGFKGVRAAGAWTVAVKPRPDQMDDWPSFNHGPDQNRVSHDRLVTRGLPTRLRWFNFSPWWSRDTIRRWVAAGGRLFYTKPAFNSGFTILNYKGAGMTLIALDACNGLLLWQRPLQRNPHRSKFVPHNLAATADRVYVPVDGSGVLAALDAATGKGVRTYKEAGRVDGFLLHDGKLFTRGPANAAVDAETGKVLWKNDTAGVDLIAEGRGFGVVYERNEPDRLACIELASGKIDWHVSLAHTSNKYSRPSWFYYRGALVFTHVLPRIKTERPVAKGWLAAQSPKDGRTLWTYDPEDVNRVSPTRKGAVFGAQGLIWAYVALARPKDKKYPFAFVGLDPATGREKVRHDYGFTHVEGHYRCGMHYATERFFMAGTYEFFEWKTGKILQANVIRSGCGFSGILPANGLVYTPDRHCKCSTFMQKGFTAMAPSVEAVEEAAGGLEKGPAYGAAQPPPPSATRPAAEGDRQSDWPMYRHDPARTGATASPVPAELKLLWEAPTGRGLTAPAVAEGKVFVASMDDRAVRAVSADAGKALWTYQAGGPIDTPPTIHAGLAVFGCRDGWVYCLRARDGALVWRFRAAPTNEQVVVDGRLESAWPVHGSVLVLDGVACFAAGWHTAQDGGLRLYAVRLPGGELVWKRHYGETFEQKSQTMLRKSGFPAGLLTSDGQYIYMKGRRYGFDRKTGERSRRYPAGRIVDFGLSSFRDDCWWSWENGGGKFQWSDGRVTARMLVSGQDRSCAIFPQWPKGKHGTSFEFHGLGRFALCGKGTPAKTGEMDWAVQVPSLRMKAMAMAGGTVFVAGRSDEIAELGKYAKMRPIPRKALYDVAALSAGLGDERRYPPDGRLMAFSAADGGKLGKVALPSPPVFDGLAAARGKLYVSCLDGKLRCYGPK